MKILLQIAILIIPYLALSQNMFDLKKTEVTLDTTKTNIIICISTVSCHDCYTKLNEFLSSAKYYQNSNIDVVTVSFLDSTSFTSIVTRKVFYNASKYYFPNAKQRLFVIENEDKTFYNEKIDDRLFPYIFVIEKDTVKFFKKYNDFIVEHIINNEIH